MVQVYFFLLVFLAAILLHYMLVLEHFSVSTPNTATTATTATTTPSTPQRSFSDMISTLITYVPGKDNKALTSASYDPVAANTNTSTSTNSILGAGSNAYLDQIRGVVRDELGVQLKDIKLGPKDTQNTALASRNTAAVSAAVDQANSDGLVQGQDYRTDPSCPYANGQKQPKAEPYPIDMNDYVRKDSIPCWGCTLK
jgi:hypothetical protein